MTGRYAFIFLLSLIAASRARAELAACASPPVGPAACISPATLPPGGPDPFVPGATVCLNADGSVHLESCVITSMTLPAKTDWCVNAVFALFGPDAWSGHGRLIGSQGQNPCRPAPKKQSVAASSSPVALRTSTDISHIIASDLAVALPDILLQVAVPLPVNGDWTNPVIRTLSLMTRGNAK